MSWFFGGKGRIYAAKSIRVAELNFLQLTHVQVEEENIPIYLPLSKQLLGQDQSQSERRLPQENSLSYALP